MTTRLGLLTTLWKRPALTRLVLSYYAGLSVEGVSLVGVAALTEGDEQDVPGWWHEVDHENAPLGAKWNAGLQFFEGLGVDGVVVIGSDDLLSASYFERAADLLSRGHDFVGVGSFTFYDLATGRMAYLRHLNAGAGRVLSYGLLERMGFYAWENSVDRNTDGSQNRVLRGHVRKAAFLGDLHRERLYAVDVKSSENRQPYDRLTACDNDRQLLHAERYLHLYFPAVADELLSMEAA